MRTLSDISNLLNSGADKVSINTAAVMDTSIIEKGAQKFGSQCIVVAIDAKKIDSNNWEVFTHGGRKPSGKNVMSYVKEAEKKGAGEILLTSMDRDGTKKGYDIDLIKSVTNSIKIPVIASGGVGKLEHLYEGLQTGKASAVLAASVFHFGEFSIKQVKEYLKSMKLSVRL